MRPSARSFATFAMLIALQFEAGFRAGVKTTNPKAQVLVQYTGSFDNVQHGKQAAADLVGAATGLVLWQALFALLEFDVTDQVKLTAEGRYAEDEISVGGTSRATKSSATGFVPGSYSAGCTLTSTATPAAPDSATLTCVNDYHDTKTFESFLPRFTATWLVNDDLTLYAQFAKGNKPGGFSANGGVVTKLKMLEIEGAVVNHTPQRSVRIRIHTGRCMYQLYHPARARTGSLHPSARRLQRLAPAPCLTSATPPAESPR